MKFTKNEVSFYILVFGIFLSLSYYFYKFHYSVINSSAFSSFITLLVGSVAIFIYLKQKSDTKVQAARVLLLEIRTAENRIDQLKERLQIGNTEDLPSLFPTKSWKNYAHLFVSDFDQDELKLIADFYDYGDLIEDFAKKNNDFFWVTTEERARVVQQKLAELVVHSQTRPEGEEVDLDTLKKHFLDVFANDIYTYTPKKSINEIENHIKNMPGITTTSAGLKLKKLAKI